jgi:uncharacterized membrane protein
MNRAPRPYLLAVCCGVLLYTAIFSTLAIRKYHAYNFGIDLSNMTHAIYNTTRGRLLEDNKSGSDRLYCRLAGHTEFIYLALAPVYALFPFVETLLILQSLALGLGGFAVFCIAREGLKDPPTALALAGTYWLFPFLASINLVGFYADPFMIFPHLMAWYFHKRGNRFGFWICIGAGMLVKEYVFLFNLLLGAAIAPRDRKKGALLAGLAAFQFLLLTPLTNFLAGREDLALQLETHAVNYGMFASLRALTGEIAAKLLSREFFAATAIIATIGNVTLLKKPRLLIPIVPLYLAYALHANTGPMFSNHRHAILIAPLFIAMTEGMAALAPHRRRVHALACTLLPAAAITFLYPGVLIGQHIAEMTWRSDYRSVFHYRKTAHDRLADSLLARIPDSIPIAVEPTMRARMSKRRWVYGHTAPPDSTRARFYVYDFFETLAYRDNLPKRRRCANLLQSPSFRCRSHLDGLVVIEQAPADARRPCVFEPARRDAPPPGDGRLFDHVEIREIEDGYVLGATVLLEAPPRDILAFISFFAAGNDTIRVLHLPSYTAVSLDTLDAGIYREEFFFQTPAGRDIQGRSHTIALYTRSRHMPFFARDQYRIASHTLTDSVALTR